MKTKEDIIPKNVEVDELKTENVQETEESVSKPKKEMGISIWDLLSYFIIYSFVGFIIETLFGVVTKGVIESRQSFLYGPFCAIYGLGACVMIVSLQKLKKSHNYLFIGGFIIGSVIEYMVSFFGEMIYHVKWWDYSDQPFNLNGRICVGFSFFWGVLAMYLMKSFNPKVDRLIEKIKSKMKSKQSIKKLVIFIFTFMVADFIITSIALNFFQIRKIVEYDLDVDNKEYIMEEYDRIYGDLKLSKFIYKFWGDRKMIRTFPNLKIQDKSGNIVYFKTLVPDVAPYYVMIYEKEE